jgi:hypothetical protein
MGLIIPGVVIFTSLLLFWQDQVPVVTYRIDQTNKSITVTNQSVIPVLFSVYVVEYDLNEKDGMYTNKPINTFYDRGFLQKETLLWPFISHTFLFSNDPLLKFLPFNATSGLESLQVSYCLVMEAKSYLSNQSSSYTDFTDQYDFPLSDFGQNPQNSSAGGGFESEQFIMNLRNELVTSCNYEAGRYE